MYIAIDLGGTNTRIASSKDLTFMHKMHRFPTAGNLESQKQQIEDAISQVSEGYAVNHICIGVPGIVDTKTQTYAHIANYPQINGMPFKELITHKYQEIPLKVTNDAMLAGLGEAIYGGGMNYKTIAYITLSTGVGGVKISNKKIDLFQPYFEPGHHIINFDSEIKDTKIDMMGTLEAYTSGTAFEKQYNVQPQLCNDQEIWDVYAQYLSYGIINIIAFWAPEAIIIGGGLSFKYYDYIQEPLLEYLNKQTFFEIPTIARSTLLDDAGVYGGIAYLKQYLLENRLI